jgi:hypothetical protein
LIKHGEETVGQGIRLVDAFEHDTIALFQTTPATPESKNFCFAPGGTVDCSIADSFISLHMRN